MSQKNSEPKSDFMLLRDTIVNAREDLPHKLFSNTLRHLLLFEIDDTLIVNWVARELELLYGYKINRPMK